ncbi:MAG: hypothetical protein AAGA23_05860 [Pseudomonadota bacterium]
MQKGLSLKTVVLAVACLLVIYVLLQSLGLKVIYGGPVLSQHEAEVVRRQRHGLLFRGWRALVQLDSGEQVRAHCPDARLRQAVKVLRREGRLFEAEVYHCVNED